MALKIPKVGLQQMLKEGYSVQQGLEEAVFRNINATVELGNIVRTSFGPNGRNKMVINHLEKLFVTSDAATIIKELEVVHPAAKMVVLASQQQEAEMGDGTNLVIVLATELLKNAEFLLRMGLHPSEVVDGFDVAHKKTLEVLNELATAQIGDPKVEANLMKVVRPAIDAKQHGYEDLLSKLVVQASLEVMPKKPENFNVDSIRVVKILGSSVEETAVVKGMVFGREPDSTLQKATKAKVAVFTCPLDVQMTETKGTVLIKNAGDMLNFSKGEESQMEQQFREIAESGAKVLVTGSSIGDLALHFINRMDMVVVKVLSKFDLRRLCKVIGATALTRVGKPLPEELGYCDIVETVEIGSDRCTVFRQEDESTKTATIVVRGGTMNLLDDIERAIDDGVNVVKSICKDQRIVPGGGATEIEIARRLAQFGDKTAGLNQYSIKKFAESLEVVPKTLAENAGLDSTDVISSLYAAHQKEGGASVGVNIEPEQDAIVCDAAAKGIWDSAAVKSEAIKLATHAALTVLSVDQIIMSKPAGGPKLPKGQSAGQDDDD